MKKIYSFVLALLPLMTFGQDRVMLIADPHVIQESVLKNEANYEEYMAKQRKMLDLSEPIWNALIDTAMKYKPALLLIPGDLTRDGEESAHNLVSTSLNQLQEAGIRSLVIPGNHDLPGANWETLYPGSYQNADKDPNGSHSYAVEPLDGVTVIGIDGSDGNAGTGKLSDETLAWILAQADAATAKGNMIIAMCHWQLLEHFDKQSSLESSCRLKNADDIRNQLMHHGVRLVLTGHFHVNGITTFRDTTGLTTDSIVEITTGAPITYPCPYRWLTLSKDRATLSVETETLTAIPGIADLHTYSREWMKEHTKNMIPVMGKRVLAQKDELINKMISQYPGFADYAETLVKLINKSLPKDEDDQIELFERHLGNTVVELYLVHSDANEPEHPEADSLAQEVYKGMDSLIDEVTIENSDFMVSLGWKSEIGQFALAVMRPKVREYAEEPIQSLVGDTTHWKSAKYYDRTDDLHLTLTINKPRQSTGIEDQLPMTDDPSQIYYDLLGRPVAEPVKGQLYIRNRKKILY